MSIKGSMWNALAGAAAAIFNPRNVWGRGTPSNEPAPNQGLTIEEMEARDKAHRDKRAEMLHERELEKTAKSMEKLAKQGLTVEDLEKRKKTGKGGRKKVDENQKRLTPTKKRKKKRAPWKKRKWGSNRKKQNLSKGR